jgi:putative ATPase
VANAAHQVLEFIGMPEGRIPLAEAAVYVATAPKSNAAYIGIDAALDDIKNNRLQEVPEHLKDASYRGAKRLGRGAGYKYAHDYEDHYVPQDYVGIKKKYYAPSDQGYEKQIRARLEGLIKKFETQPGR